MSVEIEVEVEVETVVVTGDDYLTATADRPEIEPRCVTDHVRRCLVLMLCRLIALSPYRLTDVSVQALLPAALPSHLVNRKEHLIRAEGHECETTGRPKT
jgi:hypothetical protein